MLPVKSLAVSVAFYEQLGFRAERQVDDWGWAHLRCGECELMIDQSINLHPSSPRPTVVYLYPESIIAFHQDLRRKGLTVPDLDVTFYGMTEFRIDDPDGNRLWIGQDLSRKL